MKVLYNGQEIDLDGENIQGRDEFDTLINEDLEDTIEININDIESYQGENNG